MMDWVRLRHVVAAPYVLLSVISIVFGNVYGLIAFATVSLSLLVWIPAAQEVMARANP